MKKIKRIMCALLATIMLTSTMLGCGNEQVNDIPTIVPEEQIFSDKYERHADITETIGFILDCISYPNNYMGGIEPLRLFEKFKVQVDDIASTTVGTSKLGEVVFAIDQANENYVKEMTQKIIDERQAAIDKEYEEAKAAAEAKGKEYTKEKKKVRTDDIHFDNPYTYQVVFSNGYETTKEDYKPTMLIDPAKHSTMILEVSKYGIPYVVFECVSVYYIYNTRIVQESDWIVTGIKAADVTSYIPEEKAVDENGEPLSAPAFVDVDGLNKASKRNVVMSGDIAFGGEGFTWDSLMMLCNALDLKEGSNDHGFVQSSDAQFTYYTINILADHIVQIKDEYSGYVTEYIPFIRLVATFDPLSQVCLNWTVDVHASSKTVYGVEHDRGEIEYVNVHEYQVDTNNYPAMRQKIQDWINQHAAPLNIDYYAIKDDKDQEVFGVVDSGILNATSDITIDGVKYYALEATINEDGSVTGTYISETDRNAALAIEDTADQEKKMWDNAERLHLECCAVNNKNEKLFSIIEGETTYGTTDENYYVASYEISDDGYIKNMKLLTEDNVAKLLIVYTKTYSLDKDESAAMTEALRKDENLADVKKFIDDKFAEAEAAQKEQQGQGGQQKPEQPDEEVKLFIPGLATNTTKKIEAFKVDGKDTTFAGFANPKSFDFKGTNIAGYGNNELYEGGYTAFYKDYDRFNMWSDSGVLAMFEFDSSTISNYDTFEFYNGIKLGMSFNKALEAMGDKAHRHGDYIVLKNEKYSLVIRPDFFEEAVEAVYIIQNVAYQNLEASTGNAES